MASELPNQLGKAYHQDPTHFQTGFRTASQSPMQFSASKKKGLMGGQEGKDGNIHQCYKMWQSFSRCYANAENEAACRLQWEDWRECYTHRKEIQRMKRVSQQFEKNLLAEGKSRAEVRRMVKQGLIVSVNLIEAETDLAEIERERAGRA